MKASTLALALSCLLSQLSVGAFAVDEGPCEIHRTGGTLAAHSSSLSTQTGLRANGSADQRRSRELASEACSLLNSARYEAAESKLRAALELEPALPSAECNLGLLLNKTGRPREAIPHLQLACKGAPDAPAPFVTLAASFQLCGNLSQAVDQYSKYISRFPEAPDRAVIEDIIRQLKDEAANGTGTPMRDFHWTKKQLRIFVHAPEAVKGFEPTYGDELIGAFRSWSQSGFVDFVFVSTPEQADIECQWTDDIRKLSSPGEGGEAVLQHHGSVLTHARLTLLTSRPANQARLSFREIKTLCLHEIGHALGLMNHSDRPDDVMYCTLTAAAAPSKNDFAALQSVYASH